LPVKNYFAQEKSPNQAERNTKTGRKKAPGSRSNKKAARSTQAARGQLL